MTPRSIVANSASLVPGLRATVTLLVAKVGSNFLISAAHATVYVGVLKSEVKLGSVSLTLFSSLVNLSQLLLLTVLGDLTSYLNPGVNNSEAHLCRIIKSDHLLSYRRRFIHFRPAL